MLGAAPRTCLHGAVVLIAAAAALMTSSSAIGQTLPVRDVGPATPKLWAIQLGGTSHVRLKAAWFQTIASDGINAVVTTRSGWSPVDHRRLVRLAKAARLRLIEPRSLPTTRAASLALRSACRGGAAGADSCAVAAPNALSAQTWIRRGSVRYVVLTVSSAQAFIDLGINATKKTRLIAIVRLPAATRVGSTWGAAVASAAGDGPDLAVSAGGTRQSPALGSYLRMLKTATTPSAQAAAAPAPAPAPPTALGTPGNLHVVSLDATSATLAWDPPSAGSAVDHYEVSVNGASVMTTSTASGDRDRPTGGVHLR